MRPVLKDSDWQLFLESFGALDPAAETGVRDGLARYLKLLLVENEKVNLTSITDWHEAVWKHLYDSLLVLKGEPKGVVLDWGTGGGTPGIPLAIWSKGSKSMVRKAVLLDSVGKKIRAVDSFLEPLGLASSVSAVQARGEEFIAKNEVDSVVMRAVAPPERVLGWISKKVPRWIFLVGPQSFERWQKALPAFERKGFVLEKSIKAALPHGFGDRHVLVLTKKN